MRLAQIEKHLSVAEAFNLLCAYEQRKVYFGPVLHTLIGLRCTNLLSASNFR